MKAIVSILCKHPILFLVLLGGIFLLFKTIVNNSAVEARSPVSMFSVHHLGEDYLISRFYVNNSIMDSVGNGGGGGSRRCCVSLPDKWNARLSAEVRWEVHKLNRSPGYSPPESAEFVGIYKARVPIEIYDKPSSFWVHFYPGGKVRIVVSPFSFDRENHPIRWDDEQSIRSASQGDILENFFTIKELAEFNRIIESDRRKYGDWR
jgi:hypothetical protein